MKKFILIFALLILIGCSNLDKTPFGELPKTYSPNCGPENRYKFDVEINSREDFVDFIKKNQIDPIVSLDNFKEKEEVKWDNVLNAIKIEDLNSKKVYSLDYKPLDCQGYTLKMTNDGYVSVYGCCGK